MIFDGVPTGFIQGNFGDFVETNDLVLSGKVYITPTVDKMYWPGKGTSVFRKYVCPIIDGVMYAPGTKESDETKVPGVEVVASIQPEAKPSFVQYRIEIRFHGVPTVSSITPVEVEAGTDVNIGDLVQVTYPDRTIVIVDSVDRQLAVDAADRAQGYANEAAGYLQDVINVGDDILNLGSWTGPDGIVRAVVFLDEQNEPYLEV